MVATVTTSRRESVIYTDHNASSNFKIICKVMIQVLIIAIINLVIVVNHLRQISRNIQCLFGQYFLLYLLDFFNFTRSILHTQTSFKEIPVQKVCSVAMFKILRLGWRSTAPLVGAIPACVINFFRNYILVWRYKHNRSEILLPRYARKGLVYGCSIISAILNH